MNKMKSNSKIVKNLTERLQEIITSFSGYNDVFAKIRAITEATRTLEPRAFSYLALIVTHDRIY